MTSAANGNAKTPADRGRADHGNSKGGNSKGSNSKGGNSKGGNSKGSNSKGSNSKGSNSKGSNSKGSKKNASQRRNGDDNKKRSRKRSRSKKRKFDPAQYWGDPLTLPEPVRFSGSSPTPTAVVTSLGRAPLPGQEAASTHFFELVYERAANLAVALAAVEGEAPDDDEGETVPAR